MKVTVILEKGVDGTYDARVSSDKLDFMLLGTGDTVNEAIEDMMVSKEDMEELFKDEKKEFPDLEFKYKYDLPSFLEYYSKMFSYAALERITGVNQSQLSQYVQGYRKPSEKTAKKIESKLHEFAKELNQVQFV
ncbi:helix-turn-helix transcriptional regulator [Tenacibaculum maritimum]|nr:helix-turn-helix transcriptional regulator [Tenacibaculum maritimum]MDB0602168.1 helix-turn-helix transcriptional regulator [Tenacibaculum maritimum]MDB0613844.1 helix-turn-helix transcriptional regulator [Tenacibaculum maritimum]